MFHDNDRSEVARYICLPFHRLRDIKKRVIFHSVRFERKKLMDTSEERYPAVHSPAEARLSLVSVYIRAR